MDMLHLEVANKAYDVVVLVETHLDSSIADSEIFPANYLVFRRDRMCNGRCGGGVLIAVSDTFKSSLRDDMLSDSELIFVDISFPNDCKITVGAFYRPHNLYWICKTFFKIPHIRIWLSLQILIYLG